MIDRKVIIMKCNNCGCDNPDDAKYCRVCGNVLQLESFFEKLSELGFMPTTMITLKGSLGATLLLYLLELLFVIGCLMVIGGIIVFFVQPLSVQVFFGLGGFVCSFVIAYVSFKYKFTTAGTNPMFENNFIYSKNVQNASFLNFIWKKEQKQ